MYEYVCALSKGKWYRFALKQLEIQLRKPALILNYDKTGHIRIVRFENFCKMSKAQYRTCLISPANGSNSVRILNIYRVQNRIVFNRTRVFNRLYLGIEFARRDFEIGFRNGILILESFFSKLIILM